LKKVRDTGFADGLPNREQKKDILINYITCQGFNQHE